VPTAWVAGQWVSELVSVSHDLADLDRGGRWVVFLPYAGTPVLCQFARWGSPEPENDWNGRGIGPWHSSMTQHEYCSAVEVTRAAIAAGTVYQANICRILAAACCEDRIVGLFPRLLQGNPAPYAALLDVPEIGVHVASATPELFLRRADGWITSGPIKGTGRVETDLRAKDRAENVMIVDLVRNDLGRVCEAGSIAVPAFLRVEQHPGLVHLVSEVTGRLRPEVTWSQIVQATFPPGSVTGAPKSSALRLIEELEGRSRDAYCGAIGWVDADAGTAELGVAIRTFWLDDGELRFGTGAGITWGSDPQAEWEETELKAARLIALATA
jgi:para-aminobenzoate synthetase component 1